MISLYLFRGPMIDFTGGLVASSQVIGLVEWAICVLGHTV